MANASLTTAKKTITAKVYSVDLTPILYKLVNPEEGDGWTVEFAQEQVDLYRKFLILNAIYPNIQIVPTKDVDKVWHTHILDTVKYFADTFYIFGTYFHHFPYFGLRGEQDALDLQVAFEMSKLLFAEHFGCESSPSGGFASDCGPTCSGGGCGGCADNVSSRIAKMTPESLLSKSNPVQGIYADNKARPRL